MSSTESSPIARLLDAFEQALAARQLVKCTLSKPTATAEAGLKNVYLRPVEIKGQLRVAFNHRYQTRDEVKNFTPAEARARLEQWLGHTFLNADLLTTTQDWSLTIDPQGKTRLQTKAATHAAAAPTTHNRDKNRLLDPAAPWLHRLGITNAKGEVLPTAQDKWRQINKFLEIIDALLREHPLPPDAYLADMGSGKGYLTFALYDFLRQRLPTPPHLTGIELRQPLVDFCNKAAQEAGFERLTFIADDIANYQPPRLDLLIALHACDTATDLALAKGIHAQAGIVVVAPCCHKQIRREMSAQNELAPVLRHGILEERQAEIVTDGIRALLLEANGYRTQVFEFISTDHTAKNVMITAIATDKKAVHREQALSKVAALKSGFGIKSHFLETLL